MLKEIFLFLDWLVEQLLDGVLGRWLLQPASLCPAHSQEGWHNHDNGEDGAEGQGEGWSGAKGAGIPPDVFETPCVSSISSFLSCLPLLQTPTAHCWSVQYLFVGHANTGKVQAPFLYIRVGSFFKDRGVYGGRMCIPLVPSWHPFSW